MTVEIRSPMSIASTVYQATNTVTGHTYIGITSRLLSTRQREHKCCKSPNTATSTRPFAAAIRKHGYEAFVWDVLMVCCSYGTAKQFERRLIAERAPEYNATAGGDGALGHKHSEATRKRLREIRASLPEPRLGKLSPGSGLKGQATKLARGTVAKPWLGKKRSPETIAKVVAANKGRKRAALPDAVMDVFRDNMRRAARNRCRPVILVETGQIFPSAAEASIAIGCCITSVASAIRRGLKIHGHAVAYVSQP